MPSVCMGHAHPGIHDGSKKIIFLKLRRGLCLAVVVVVVVIAGGVKAV